MVEYLSDGVDSRSNVKIEQVKVRGDRSVIKGPIAVSIATPGGERWKIQGHIATNLHENFCRFLQKLP